MTVTIRTYEARDAEVVWALHLEGVRDGRADHPELDYAGHEEDLRDIESAYLSPGSNFWVAEVDGLLVGMAAIQRIDAETGRLRRMRVTDAWRRRGVAAGLLKTAEEFCRGRGYKRVILDTTKQQQAAQQLYERAAYVRTGDRMLGPFTLYDYEKVL